MNSMNTMRSARTRIAFPLVFIMFIMASSPRLTAMSAPPAAVTIYLSPHGNDAWNGLSPRGTGANGPVATLEGARDAIRRLRVHGLNRGTVSVRIADGRYE